MFDLTWTNLVLMIGGHLLFLIIGFMAVSFGIDDLFPTEKIENMIDKVSAYQGKNENDSYVSNSKPATNKPANQPANQPANTKPANVKPATNQSTKPANTKPANAATNTKPATKPATNTKAANVKPATPPK